MSWILILVLVVLAVIGFGFFITQQASGGGKIGFPYLRTKTLFSVAERSFLGVLDQAAGPDCRVFGKVRVADVAMVKSGLGRAAQQGALNRIAFKHFDFVICRASDLEILCAIELNDKSHASKKTQARDDLLLNVCQAINLPIFTVQAKQSYSSQELRELILPVITLPVPPRV